MSLRACRTGIEPVQRKSVCDPQAGRGRTPSMVERESGHSASLPFRMEQLPRSLVIVTGKPLCCHPPSEGLQRGELQPDRVAIPQGQGHPGLGYGAGLAAGQGSPCTDPASRTAQEGAVLSSVPGLRAFENMKDSSSSVQTA